MQIFSDLYSFACFHSVTAVSIDDSYFLSSIPLQPAGHRPHVDCFSPQKPETMNIADFNLIDTISLISLRTVELHWCDLSISIQLYLMTLLFTMSFVSLRMFAANHSDEWSLFTKILWLSKFVSLLFEQHYLRILRILCQFKCFLLIE